VVPRGGLPVEERAARCRDGIAGTQEENKIMTTTVLQSVMWVVAGVALALLIIRRGKRKAS